MFLSFNLRGGHMINVVYYLYGNAFVQLPGSHAVPLDDSRLSRVETSWWLFVPANIPQKVIVSLYELVILNYFLKS